MFQKFLRVFFHQLYHGFAFAYDFVAATVSFGHWKNWLAEIVPFIKGTRVLEIGHGPGHLQRILRNRKFDSTGLDESPQMGFLAKRRLDDKHKLTRGVAQNLPFANDSFDSVVATFPTDYIFHARTLSEIRRCLSNGGRLAVLPVAYPTSGILRRLYQITGETPSDLNESLKSKIKQPFIAAGFETEIKTVETQNSVLLIVVATNKK